MSSDIATPHLTYKPMRSWEFKTSELTTTQKREARALLFGYFRQTKCFLTGAPIYAQILHAGGIDIHHLTEGPGRNFLPNLRLAYHGPNANAGRPGIQSRDRDRNRKSPVLTDATVQLREVVSYSEGSKEMQANVEAEPVFRSWLLQKLLEEKQITKEEAIWSGAEKTGVSGQATRDYLKKLCSNEGPLEEVRGSKPKVIVIRKEKRREWGLES